MTTGFGAFGKLPSMGDFLRHNLPSGFVQTWDTWLQAGMLNLRETMAERWADAYMSAPIWRFTLPAGFAGAQAVSGIMMASVDRVGRQYPLTLAAPHDGTHSPSMTHLRHSFARPPIVDLTPPLKSSPHRQSRSKTAKARFGRP